MSDFKDLIRSDIHKTFLNLDEFSEMHMVDGKEMAIQIDGNEQIEREKRVKQHMEGIFKNQKLIYAAADDFGPMPKHGSVLNLDGRTYKVEDAIHEDGIYSITLEANRS